MKKKQVNKKLKAFVLDCAKNAGWVLRVQQYDIEVQYMDEDKKGECGCSRHVAATMEVNRRYYEATLSVYPLIQRMWARGQKDEIRHVIFHEVAHITTQHLYQVAVATYRDQGEMDDAWESLTEIVGRLAAKVDRLENKK